MEIFIDSGDLAEVRELAGWGVLSGATTNPSLLAKAKGDPSQVLRDICQLVNGPTSAEVVTDQASVMVEQGQALSNLDPRIVVKLPFSAAGLTASRELANSGIRINMTLVFSAAQALLAAEAGATYVSCFMGRLDDIAVNSSTVVGEIVRSLHGSDAQVLAASLRSPLHAVQAAELGCHVATIPPAVLRQMLNHPLTTTGTERFTGDWTERPELGKWMDKLLKDFHAQQQ